MDGKIVERLNCSNTWWQLKGCFHTFSPETQLVRLALSSARFPRNSIRAADFGVGLLDLSFQLLVICVNSVKFVTSEKQQIE